MPKRIFLAYPFTPAEAEPLNPELAQLAFAHGGLAHILDPRNEVPAQFLDQLKSHGYSVEEIHLYRQILASEGRESLLFSLACLGHLAASAKSELLKTMYQGYFFNFSKERKAHDISFEEIRAAADQLSPLMSAP